MTRSAYRRRTTFGRFSGEQSRELHVRHGEPSVRAQIHGSDRREAEIQEGPGREFPLGRQLERIRRIGPAGDQRLGRGVDSREDQGPRAPRCVFCFFCRVVRSCLFFMLEQTTRQSIL